MRKIQLIVVGIVVAVGASLIGFTVAGADKPAPNEPTIVQPDLSRQPDTVPCQRPDGTVGSMPNVAKMTPPTPGSPEGKESAQKSDEFKNLKGVKVTKDARGNETVTVDEDAPDVRQWERAHSLCK